MGAEPLIRWMAGGLQLYGVINIFRQIDIVLQRHGLQSLRSRAWSTLLITLRRLNPWHKPTERSTTIRFSGAGSTAAVGRLLILTGWPSDLKRKVEQLAQRSDEHSRALHEFEGKLEQEAKARENAVSREREAREAAFAALDRKSIEDIRQDVEIQLRGGVAILLGLLLQTTGPELANLL